MAEDSSRTPLTADRLWTVADVARFLGVSVCKAYTLKERIGYVSLGRHVRFRPEAVQAYVEANTRWHPVVTRYVSSAAPILPTGTWRSPTVERSPRASEIRERLRQSGRHES
jgi:excisionase family DNA binding protein